MSFDWLNFETNLEKFNRIKKQIAQFTKIELCIETVLQIVFNILLLVFSQSETRIQQGLEAIFFDNKDENPLFGLSPYVFMVVNIAWSIRTCWKSFVKGMMATKDHFPSKPYYLLGLYVLISVTIRCMNAIIYFAPVLGLLDLLRHYQAERNPFFAAKGTKIGDKVYLPGKPQKWTWYDISRIDYTDPENPISPDLTIYTHFSMEQYLYGFWIILCVQALVHILVKRLSNPLPFKRQNWIYMIANGIENCQIPVPMEDWDDQHGSIDYYVKAQKKVELEMGLTMVVNFVFNLIMTVPMWILCKNTTLFLYI